MSERFDRDGIAEAGLRTAAGIVDQMLRLTRQLSDGRWPVTLFGTPEMDDDPHAVPADGHGHGHTSNGNGNGNGNGHRTNGHGPAGTAAAGGGRRADLRALRADAERLIELYGDWSRTLLDGFSDLAEGAGESAPEVVVLGPVDAGEVATAVAYLHLFEGPLPVGTRPHLTELTAHHRGTIGGTHGAITVDDAGPTSERVTLRVSVAVPADTPAGAYWGHLLVEHLPELHLAVRVEVR